MPLLSLLPDQERGRVKRDRLELLTTLINAPTFDALFRADIVTVPADHPVFGWQCEIDDCDRVSRSDGLCHGHGAEWRLARSRQVPRADFLRTAKPGTQGLGTDPGVCRICRHRPAVIRAEQLCQKHRDNWQNNQRSTNPLAFEQWLASQQPARSFEGCQVAACPYLAASPVGLCVVHRDRYRRAGQPGGAQIPNGWQRDFELKGLSVPVLTDDALAFRRWCAEEEPVYRSGSVNLLGLQPLVKAEIQWGLYAHTQHHNPARWDCSGVQHLAVVCRTQRVASLFDLTEDVPGRPQLPGHRDSRIDMIVREIVEGLWCIYYSPQDTRDAGFIETDHFGRRFGSARSYFDLSQVSQRWLRDMLWDHFADVLQSPRCPRSRGPFDNFRRAAVELSAFLEADAPSGGHNPALLEECHAQRFVADQRHRARHGLTSLGMHRADGAPSVVTEITRRAVFNHLRVLARRSLETGECERIGLDRAFITALPSGGADPKRSRSPFSDDVARALADENNLARLAAEYDPNDRGLRDAWETIVFTGRRCSEVLTLRLDCLGRYRDLPMLWHDQTKVGHFNEAIRIPEGLYQRLDTRRRTTLARFENRHARPPTPAERAKMALFPTHHRYITGDRSMSYGHFNTQFKAWVDSLDLGPAVVAHQARHTLATNLLRAGATLAHIRRYLGQVSDRMAEHYAKVADTDLEDVLNAVWVAGPGSSTPGRLLSGDDATPLSREEALALALDLSRRSTPADGGFCTFQPVVQGNACPWKLDCENCDHFVLSGADLLYWRRKQEQWRSIAERAPDDATADYLHQVFEPTARAIDGLEKALAGLGLLEEAVNHDLRRPQDYFHRIWSTSFRAADLAQLDPTPSTDPYVDTKIGEPV